MKINFVISISLLVLILGSVAFSEVTINQTPEFIIGKWVIDSTEVKATADFPKDVFKPSDVKGQIWVFQKDGTFEVYDSHKTPMNKGDYIINKSILVLSTN